MIWTKITNEYTKKNVSLSWWNRIDDLCIYFKHLLTVMHSNISAIFLNRLDTIWCRKKCGESACRVSTMLVPCTKQNTQSPIFCKSVCLIQIVRQIVTTTSKLEKPAGALLARSLVKQRRPISLFCSEHFQCTLCLLTSVFVHCPP